MIRSADDDFLQRLERARNGDREALDQIFGQMYDELRALARRVRRGRASPTLNTTALVHEAYMKFLPSPSVTVESRAHFRSIVARAMRQVLVDAARASAARRRGGGQILVTITESISQPEIEPADVLALDRALTELASVDPRRAQVVEFRFFAGLDVEETAAAMGISSATVKRDWRIARAWLAQASA